MSKVISKNLKDLADPARAENSQRFFKTGKGEYGEGDIFIGVRVPEIRTLVKRYCDISIDDILVFLKSPIHEERLFALLALVKKYTKGSDQGKSKIYRLYLNNIKYINNWDLVDSSASYIVGAYLLDKDKKPLYKLARSNNLWKRRVAVLSTFYMIDNNDFDDGIAISELLKNDSEDLIHKAVGWMLREIGKRNLTVEETFLKQNYKTMPRTMLRYAIEKFPEKKRKAYLKGEI